jgi:hypothetical protein
VDLRAGLDDLEKRKFLTHRDSKAENGGNMFPPKCCVIFNGLHGIIYQKRLFITNVELRMLKGVVAYFYGF